MSEKTHRGLSPSTPRMDGAATNPSCRGWSGICAPAKSIHKPWFTPTDETPLIMGYFSNGSEGDAFENQWCSRCVHREGPDGKSGCAVWLAHLLFSYKLCNKHEDEGKQILDILIPDKDGFNDGCTMFHEGKAVVAEGCLDGRSIHTTPATVMPAMREWAKKKGLIVK